MLTVKNWGYLASLGHFEIVAAENGERPKSDITQPLLLTVLPHHRKFQSSVERTKIDQTCPF